MALWKQAWLAQNVVPHILSLYPHESSHIGMTLALPLVWACLEPTMQSKVPEDLRQRVQDLYAAICQLDEGVNLPHQEGPNCVVSY